MGYATGVGSQMLDSAGNVWVYGYNGDHMLGLGSDGASHLILPGKVRF